MPVVTAAGMTAQSQPQTTAAMGAPLFLERRSRPRHGTIKLIEDVVYRAMREEARRAAPVPHPCIEPPPTLAFYSERARRQWTVPGLLGAILGWIGKARLRPTACKFFCLITGKQLRLSAY
jgi:hypothetical protein